MGVFSSDASTLAGDVVDRSEQSVNNYASLTFHVSPMRTVRLVATSEQITLFCVTAYEFAAVVSHLDMVLYMFYAGVMGIPTLGNMRRGVCWVWVHCANWRCRHKMPVALAPCIILWGESASSDVLRQCARCSRCGHKGATLQHPSWAGADVGYAPFPVEYLA